MSRIPTTFENLLVRIEIRTNKIPNGCWIWNGAKSKHGYGQIVINGKKEYIHRLSAHLYLGLNLDDKFVQVNHKRNCPNPNCWNPEHIYIGTKLDNINDAVILGTHSNQFGTMNRTSCVNGHKYTEENTYVNPNGRKECRICRHNHTKKYNESMREIIQQKQQSTQTPPTKSEEK